MALLHMAVDMLVQWWLMFIVLWCMEGSFYILLMSRVLRARWAWQLIQTDKKVFNGGIVSDLYQVKSTHKLMSWNFCFLPFSWGCCMNATPWPSSWSRQEAWQPQDPWMFWTSSPPPSTSEFPWSWDPLMTCRSIFPSVRSITNEVCNTVMHQTFTGTCKIGIN